MTDHLERLQSAMLASGWLTGRFARFILVQHRRRDHSDTKPQADDKSIEIVRLGNHVRVTLNGERDLSDVEKRHTDRSAMQQCLAGRCDYRRIRIFLAEMLSRRFCAVMDRYYQLIVKHREKFKMEFVRRLQLGQI